MSHEKRKNRANEIHVRKDQHGSVVLELPYGISCTLDPASALTLAKRIRDACPNWNLHAYEGPHEVADPDSDERPKPLNQGNWRTGGPV